MRGGDQEENELIYLLMNAHWPAPPEVAGVGRARDGGGGSPEFDEEVGGFGGLEGRGDGGEGGNALGGRW